MCIRDSCGLFDNREDDKADSGFDHSAAAALRAPVGRCSSSRYKIGVARKCLGLGSLVLCPLSPVVVPAADPATAAVLDTAPSNTCVRPIRRDRSPPPGFD